MTSATNELAGYVYVWTYHVRAGREAEFERLYGPDGAWARFFAGNPSYLGTELLRSLETGSYVTVDRWVSREAHEAFVAGHRAEWRRLDAMGEALTAREERIGEFFLVRSAADPGGRATSG